MKTYDVLIEVGDILRGVHKAWSGDSVRNAEVYLNRLANDFSNAAEIADDIEKNMNDASDISGLSSTRLQWIVNRIRERI